MPAVKLKSRNFPSSRAGERVRSKVVFIQLIVDKHIGTDNQQCSYKVWAAEQMYCTCCYRLYK